MVQSYEIEADNEYVIRGNSAIMKCEVPSFVSDFVIVENWQDSNGRTYLPGSNDGNFFTTVFLLPKVPNPLLSSFFGFLSEEILVQWKRFSSFSCSFQS